MKLVSLFIALIIGVLFGLLSCTNTPEPTNTTSLIYPSPANPTASGPLDVGDLQRFETTWAKIIPVKGTPTEYEIPLSLGNTQKFIDLYNSVFLIIKRLVK